MIEPSGTGYITLAELDTFVGDELGHHPHAGASIVLQQPNEPIESLQARLRKSARSLRESGCCIASTNYLLGARCADRLTERLELARSLLDLLTDSSATLHLISTGGPGEQEGLFELVGWLLADAHHSHSIRLTFRDHAPVSCVRARPRLSVECIAPAFDLTA